MRRINVPEFNSTHILPLRSASSLFYHTFCKLFEIHNIECDDTIDTPPQLNNFIYVRNPIDRFFSTYYYYNKNFKNISEFIDNYRNFLLTNTDGHLSPQSVTILTCDYFYSKNYEDFNLKKKYDETFNKHYDIVRVEKIESVINNSFFSHDEIDFYNFDYTKTIDFIPPNLVSTFVSLYVYHKNYFDKFHHKKINYRKQITQKDYEKVKNMFKKECDFFGYQNKF